MTVKNILTSSSLIKCLQSKMALKNYIAKSFFLKSGKRFKRSIAHNNLKLTCNIYHIQVFKLRPFLQIGLRWRHLDIRRWGRWVGENVFEGVEGGVWELGGGVRELFGVGRGEGRDEFVQISFCLRVAQRVETEALAARRRVNVNVLSLERLPQSSVNIAWGWEGSTRVKGEDGRGGGVRSRGEVRVGVSLTT